METSTLSALLGDTWFGAGLPVVPRARLALLGRLVDVEAGQVLLREGAVCEDLGVIVAGRIAIRLALPGREDRTILTIEPGDIFGWSAVLPPAIATSTCVTAIPSRVILFDGVSLAMAMRTDRELAAVVYERLLVAVARRLSATRFQLLDLYRAASDPW
jgi:CRP/FNR family transcriptional regulator, cyclic AMP receptor protein